MSRRDPSILPDEACQTCPTVALTAFRFRALTALVALADATRYQGCTMLEFLIGSGGSGRSVPYRMLEEKLCVYL